MPLSCEGWKQWLDHIQEMAPQIGERTATQLDDAASQRWLATRSKPCPKCRYSVQEPSDVHICNLPSSLHLPPSFPLLPSSPSLPPSLPPLSSPLHPPSLSSLPPSHCRAPIEKTEGCNHMCCKKVRVPSICVGIFNFQRGKSGLPKIEGGKPCIETVLCCVTWIFLN